MAAPTLVIGDTLSLSNLAGATGQGTKSMSAAAGSSATPIKMSEFALDSVNTEITGFTYVVESTSENYTMGYLNDGTRFNRITTTASNFTWTAVDVSPNTTDYLTIGSSPNTSATLTAGDMSNSTGILVTIAKHLVSATFSDGFNDHIGAGAGYGVARTKDVYTVDTYDGNTALCLTANSPIIMADGTILEVGDLEDGDVLKGFSIKGLDEDSDSNYLDWEIDTLVATPKDVKVVNVVFAFSDRIFNINDGEIRGTFEHPMLVKDYSDNLYRFKRLAEIKIGDSLIKENSNSVEEIEIFSIVPENQIEEIVSIDVEAQDTYLVNGYLTHNKGGNTHTDLTTPAQVTGLVWNNTTNALTWTAVAGASAYDVQVDDINTFTSPEVDETEWSSILYNGEAITTGTRYARVRAIDHGLKGTWSTTLTFTQS